ncbi:MAG: GAF domain-containing protein [Chloroflexi bacterium]|nr:GAF domain-containing protein [Chloroflexota bacterium]
MSKKSAPAEEKNIFALWQKLTAELANILDAHGVCATIANTIAAYTGTTTVIGSSGPQGRYYDVWIGTGDGRIQQTIWDNAKASFDPLIKAGGAAVQHKFDLSAAELINSELWQLPRETILSIPLPMPDSRSRFTPPGLLCLIDPRPECILTPESLPPLATNITISLDRAYLRNHVNRQDVEFAVVSDISHALTSTLNMGNIFQQLMDPIRRTLLVESISVGLIEPITGDILFVDILLGPLFKNLPPIRLKRGQGIAGWVADHREPVIINDVYTDKRFFSKIDRRSGFHTESMICIPLQVEDQVIGIVQAINKSGSDFNENDLRLLQAIAGPMAAAIENARLHDDVIAEKRRVETLFANMSEGMLTVTVDGVITHTNEALLSLLGKETANLIGKNIHDIIRLKGNDLEDYINLVQEADEEYPQMATNLVRSGGGKVPALISGAPVRNEEGQVTEMIFVFSDLRLVREVERMRDDFFHGIVHELRTPLATILMYARLLREGKAREEEKANRFLGVIVRESDRLQKMVRQMLQVAKMEARELQRSPEMVYLNDLFDEMLPPLADRAIEKKLTFRQRIEKTLPPVLGDKETLYLILKNLVDNAIKFTLSGTVRVTARQENGQVFVEVKDEGIGIPQAALPNLFGRFFRAQTAVERGIAGTGLGLYLVKEGVEYHNGTINVASAEGEGTTFTIRLPAIEE